MLHHALGLLAVKWRSERIVAQLRKLESGLGRSARRLTRIAAELEEPRA